MDSALYLYFEFPFPATAAFELTTPAGNRYKLLDTRTCQPLSLLNQKTQDIVRGMSFTNLDDLHALSLFIKQELPPSKCDGIFTMELKPPYKLKSAILPRIRTTPVPILSFPDRMAAYVYSLVITLNREKQPIAYVTPGIFTPVI